MTNTNHKDQYELAMAYHRRLPERIKAYLVNQRGIAEPLIHRYRLGWNDERITIPITNRNRQVVSFRLARDPENATGPEMTSSPDTSPELYGWERLAFPRDQIVICDGEFDRLLLEAHGLPAVTSTAGPGVFLSEWAQALKNVPRVYICFHNDASGGDHAAGVASLIPNSRIIQLPDEIGVGGTIEDFLVRLGKTKEDFDRLIAGARSYNGNISENTESSHA